MEKINVIHQEYPISIFYDFFQQKISFNSSCTVKALSGFSPYKMNIYMYTLQLKYNNALI